MKITRSFEIRSIDDESRIIEGQAIVFNSMSKNLGGFFERINPGAISEEMLAKADVIATYNHEDNMMLARYTNGHGTLQLELREDGLYFRFEAPTTSLGDEILYHVRHGNLTECSFAAIVNREDIKRYRGEDGTFIQEINRIDSILDVSVVNRGAYGATSVTARSEEEAQKELEDIKRDVEAQEAAEQEAAHQAEIERNEQIISELDKMKEDFLAGIKDLDKLNVHK